MKKCAFRTLCTLLFFMVILLGWVSCSDSGNSGNSDRTDDTPQTPATDLTKTETTTDTVTSKTVWIFSDLGSVSIEGVDATNMISDAESLASAAIKYTSFSAAKNNKYSLKSDVDYLSSDQKLTAQIKSLNSDGIPIQYNKYEAETDDCTQSDASAGCLQIVGDAFALTGVQGPFAIKLNYGANSKNAKTDGRYAYVKINGTEYADETVKTAKSLDSKGVGFSYSYTGSDTVDVVVGATAWVRLYDVIISRETTQTTTVKTTTNEDGSVTTVTTVTDENGIVISEKTETINSTDENENQKGEKPSDNDPTATEEYTNGSKIGTRSALNELDTSKISYAISVSTAAEFESAITQIQSGGAIVLSEGTYAFDHQVTIKNGNDGSASAMKYILPASGAKVKLDFSSQAYDDNDTSKNARGLQIEGNYWHVYGLTVYGSADNGIFVAGKHNIIERCILQANRDTGLQISRRSSSVTNFDDWPSDNLILNCTAFDNHDPATDENADGFAAKLTCGDGNVFDGCIAYCNSDDGWDLYAKSATGSIGVVTIKNCVSFGNGKLTTGSSFANGDMNGFKLGGSNGAVPTAHIVYNCLSFGNGHDGFTDNGNGGALQVTACTAYGNAKTNFNFYRTNGGQFYKLITANAPTSGSERFATDTTPSKIEKVLFFNSKKYYYADEVTEVTKSDGKVGTVVSDPYPSEFNSAEEPAFDEEVDVKCRNADGTVNMGGYLETTSVSSYSALGAKFGSEAYTVLPLSLILN